MKTARFVTIALLTAALLGGCATIRGAREEASPRQTTKGDPYMGDWEGKWGSEKLCAQVIVLGKDAYRMNLLPEFDTPAPPMAVLQGKSVKGGVEFAGTGAEGALKGAQIAAAIKGSKMTGSVKGEVSGQFALHPVKRLSPTLGARPPRDAIVLFDGDDLDHWEQRSIDPWGVNVKKAVGGENRVAYLRTWVFAPAPGKAQFAYGVDDGAKVWLNGELVHSVIEDRKVTPCRHKVAVDLNEGWNMFLVKVAQNDKDWGFTARLRGLDAAPLKDFFVGIPEKEAYPLESFDGAVALWEASEAYTQEGKTGADLFDVAFAPELNYAAQWKPVPLPERTEPGPAKWLLVGNGAMEVRGGSIQTKRDFVDQKLHVEFRTPFMADKDGQKRGNSGVFLQNRYEVQVLDSYGLSRENNFCGGIYKTAVPKVNMCAPPLQWQTYDIIFRAARYDENWKKVKDATLTVVHNGVAVHENQPVPDKTTGSQVTAMSEPDALSLQDHGDPVWYRNVWIVELPPEK